VTAVVVLTFDAPPGMLEDCVASVIASGDASSVIVVDNGSTAAARLADRDCVVITTGRNLGFAGGMNVGIEAALDRGEAQVALLNDDATVEPGWLAPLERELAQPRVGAVQSKLLFAERRDGRDVVNSAGVELGPDGAGRDIGYDELDGPAFDEARDIELFTGGAVLLTAELLRDVGLFDERYFLYYEDVDLGLRGRKRGWRYRCAPASRVRHRGSASTSQIAERAAYLRERNRLWVLFRHRSAGDITRGLWLSLRRVRHRPRRVHTRALFAGLVAAPRLVLARSRARP
jgi:GT2 family glycosyltransferase